MPPKKKAPRAARHDSTPSGDAADEATDDVSTPAETETVKDNIVVVDSWTDEQETSLYKGMIRWKPVGSFFGAMWRGLGVIVCGTLLILNTRNA